MLDHRPFASLGAFQNEWLDARHHFSFGHYHDPNRMGVGPLVVWNDDAIRAGTGFAPHGHADMEIVTFVRAGAITHRDSVGNVGRTPAGEAQVMSAGTGIRHSEMNLEDEETRLFQIWLTPRTRGRAPRWEQRRFDGLDRPGLVAIASGRGAPGALDIDQDADLLAGLAEPGAPAEHRFAPGRRGYLVPLDDVRIDGRTIAARDGLAIAETAALTIATAGDGPARFLLADLP